MNTVPKAAAGETTRTPHREAASTSTGSASRRSSAPTSSAFACLRRPGSSAHPQIAAGQRDILRALGVAEPPLFLHLGAPERTPAQLLIQGTAAGGVFLLHQGRQAALRAQLRRPRTPRRRIRRLRPGAGRHELRFEFEPTGKPDMPQGKGAPGRLQLYIDGDLVGNADAPFTTPFVFNPGALTCGATPGSPVTPDCVGPFTFTGTLHGVTFDVSGELIHDPEAELGAHLARQ